VLLAVVTVVVLVAVVVSVTVVGVVVVVVVVEVEVSVIVVLGCLTVTFADCEVFLDALVWVVVVVTVLAPTPPTEVSTNAIARPATKAMIAAGQVHDRFG
jgi:hypothetical protein